MKYAPVIGLEVHVELKTNSKMFCGCSAQYFGKEPNTHVCPVCLGLPGALPVPNKTAIEWCIKIALALNCKINEFSKFDRKNYFYPDLAKGYQISQYDIPFGHEGNLKVPLEKGSKEMKKIKIRRVHMEEDTGKLTHSIINGEKVSLVDFNRSGVPLVEVVTEPDFENEFQVVSYLQKLQSIVRDLGVSNADMEKGDMRLEPNISLREENSDTLPNYKVEVKNINSFRFVDKAIKFEIERQSGILEEGKTPTQETRGWNEVKNQTVSQRSKEEAHDYRYFPEPDIPPITTSTELIKRLKAEQPKLADQRAEIFQSKYGLSFSNALISTATISRTEFFESAIDKAQQQNLDPVGIVNYIINRQINNLSNITPSQTVEKYKKHTTIDQITPEELRRIVDETIRENPQAVADYKKGKENSAMFLLGQVMKKAGKKLEANEVRRFILEQLK